MMKTVLCCANKKEISGIVRYFNADLKESDKKRFYVYHCNKQGEDIFFLILGMGSRNVKRNLDYFIKKYHADNSFLWVLIGFAGSISEDFKTGDIAVPDIIRNEKKTYRIKSGRSRAEQLFEVNRIYGEKEKRELKKKYPEIDIIDMESACFCEVMENNKINNYFVYKSITDEIDFIFPDFRLIKDSVFRIKPKDLCSVLLKDIKQIKYLIAIYRNISLASKNISQFFISFYENRSNP